MSITRDAAIIKHALFKNDPSQMDAHATVPSANGLLNRYFKRVFIVTVIITSVALFAIFFA